MIFVFHFIYNIIISYIITWSHFMFDNVIMNGISQCVDIVFIFVLFFIPSSFFFFHMTECWVLDGQWMLITYGRKKKTNRIESNIFNQE